MADRVHSPTNVIDNAGAAVLAALVLKIIGDRPVWVSVLAAVVVFLVLNLIWRRGFLRSTFKFLCDGRRMPVRAVGFVLLLLAVAYAIGLHFALTGAFADTTTPVVPVLSVAVLSILLAFAIGVWTARRRAKPSGVFGPETKLSDIFPEYDRRSSANIPQKQAIARTAYDTLLRTACDDAGPIVLDSGTVTLHIAEQLVQCGHCSIATNNLAISLAAQEWDDQPIRLTLFGGEIDRVAAATCGPVAADAARQQLKAGLVGVPRSRIAVLGLRAYFKDEGLFLEENERLALFQAALFEHAETLVVVTQGEKLTREAHGPPILEASKFNAIMEKRFRDKSIWLFHHQPARKLEAGTAAFYEKNFDALASRLPPGHVIDATAY